MYVRVVLLVVVTCLLVSASARHGRPRHWRPNKIPDRCVRNSVTRVRCGAVLTADQLLPHPDDCQLFYVCEQPNRPPVCRQCPAYLHFNPISHVCDWPAVANCSVATAAPTTGTPEMTETTDGITTAGTTDVPQEVSTTETIGVPETSTTEATGTTQVTDRAQPDETPTSAPSTIEEVSNTTPTYAPSTTGAK